MKFVQGTFLVNGQPRNGVTAKSWAACNYIYQRIHDLNRVL